MRLTRTTTLALVGSLSLLACSGEDDVGAVAPESVFTLTAAQSTLPADTASRTPVTVQLAVATTTGKAVTLTTTLGTLQVPGTSGASVNLTTDSTGHATADLVAGSSVGTAHVTATITSITQSLDVQIVTAYPEALTVAPGQFTLKRAVDMKATITVTLTRAVGKPTPGRIVEFAAFDSTGVQFGRFSLPAPSGADGTVTADFTTLGNGVLGTATIRARTADANGTVLEATAPLEIIQ